MAVICAVAFLMLAMLPRFKNLEPRLPLQMEAIGRDSGSNEQPYIRYDPDIAIATVTKFLKAVFRSQRGSEVCTTRPWELYLAKNGTMAMIRPDPMTGVSSYKVLDSSSLEALCEVSSFDLVAIPGLAQTLGRHTSFTFAASVADLDADGKNHVLVLPFTLSAEMSTLGDRVESAELTYPDEFYARRISAGANAATTPSQYIPSGMSSDSKPEQLALRTMTAMYGRNCSALGDFLSSKFTIQQAGETSARTEFLSSVATERAMGMAESFLPHSITSAVGTVSISGYLGDSVVDRSTGNLCTMIWPYTLIFETDVDASRVTSIRAILDFPAWIKHLKDTCHYDYFKHFAAHAGRKGGGELRTYKGVWLPSGHSNAFNGWI
eukprot:CAMPEP_0167773248 /NCGR_PEP_ID=MMETSP0111_2-20121227/1312_1 /TAXON_ID=91324 /ORGANISM="Lotharella globosa, Strain CCCM811" /LENGTH=378 /DNA_ID=CAMNT_0007662859 /DNA_START=38 /DNA_END=1174 /DNA_ORIENTATION=-